jgi:hypothetical protein
MCAPHKRSACECATINGVCGRVRKVAFF